LLSLKSAAGVFTARVKSNTNGKTQPVVRVELDAIRGMAVLGSKFALVRDAGGGSDAATVLAFKFKKRTDAADMLLALQQSTLAVPVTHQVRTRLGQRLAYSFDGGDSNQSGSHARTLFEQPTTTTAPATTSAIAEEEQRGNGKQPTAEFNMFEPNGTMAEARKLQMRLNEVTAARDASERARLEAITRSLSAERDAADARREMSGMRLEMERVAAEVATDLAQRKLDLVSETSEQVLAEVRPPPLPARSCVRV